MTNEAGLTRCVRQMGEELMCSALDMYLEKPERYARSFPLHYANRNHWLLLTSIHLFQLAFCSISVFTGVLDEPVRQ